ncbi:Hsp20/alpha crystallin family protein [Kibdelosporangium aridum]|uniref:Hsp20/alpha crystallin family protein n=1 Tax=Kibdelosporangium aridum TaxID=2030 RepID=A0A428ZAU4_KIBAR|nr:Hsp20/alpha crystallin family protein [Kibdelosporangium aridum]RSM85203.1 Hsp20/alpha crystallin family protein [Kibdelosporangium aridum]
MTSIIPRGPLFPDVVRFLESGWPFTTFGTRHAVRIEDYRDDGNYVVRAELPGMDPGKDITITVAGDELAIKAERTVEKHDDTHSEFSYGSFARTVRLPGTAVPEKVSATYDAGILEVTVPLTETHDRKAIPVQIGKKE